MKLLYYHGEKPVETYYTEIINDFADDPPGSVIVQQATMMIDFIRACESREIGFDKSVGTSHATLLFLSREPHIQGSVKVDAWRGIYTIACGLTPFNQPWRGAQYIEGKASTIDAAIQLLQLAFDYAFATLTPKQYRQVMIEWATKAYIHNELKPETPYTMRTTPKSLQTVTWQKESVQAFFHRLEGDTNHFVARRAATISNFIRFIETHEVLLPSFVYAEEDALVFVANNKKEGVRLSAALETHIISYTLPPRLAPWPDAKVKSITAEVENAAYVLENASSYYSLINDQERPSP